MNLYQGFIGIESTIYFRGREKNVHKVVKKNYFYNKYLKKELSKEQIKRFNRLRID